MKAMTTPQDDLLPCPFCGHKGVSVSEGSTFRWRYAVCDECGAQGPEVRVQTLGEGTKEEWERKGISEAVAEWNKRAHFAKQDAEPDGWIDGEGDPYCEHGWGKKPPDGWTATGTPYPVFRHPPTPDDMVMVPRDDLIHMREYWNGDYNERAMSDALDFLMNKLDFVLSAAPTKKETT